MAQALLRRAGAALLLAGAGMLVLAALSVGGAAWLLGPAAGLALLGWRPPTLAAVARAADRAGGTRDRFASALALRGASRGKAPRGRSARVARRARFPRPLSLGACRAKVGGCRWWR